MQGFGASQTALLGHQQQWLAELARYVARFPDEAIARRYSTIS